MRARETLRINDEINILMLVGEAGREEGHTMLQKLVVPHREWWTDTLWREYRFSMCKRNDAFWTSERFATCICTSLP